MRNFCHSLGSHVVTRAIAMLGKEGVSDRERRLAILRRIDMVFFLGGAEYVVEAELMYRRVIDTVGNQHLSFYNFVSRANDALDLLGENFGPRTFGNTNVIGHNGLDVEDPQHLGNWLDLQIDSRKVQEWMSIRDIEVSGDRPGNVWDHWYYYTPIEGT